MCLGTRASFGNKQRDLDRGVLESYLDTVDDRCNFHCGCLFYNEEVRRLYQIDLPFENSVLGLRPFVQVYPHVTCHAQTSKLLQ